MVFSEEIGKAKEKKRRKHNFFKKKSNKMENK
jgi:hypothetical protein